MENHRLHVPPECYRLIDDQYFSRNSSGERLGSQLTHGAFLHPHVDKNAYACFIVDQIFE
jgi:hypothetical protein